MSIPFVHRINVCRYKETSLRCKYLSFELSNSSYDYICLKNTPDQARIDREITLFMQVAARMWKDPQLMTVALGDNCPGYGVEKPRSNYGVL